MKMKSILLAMMILSAAGNLQAGGGPSYPTSTIPEALLKGADAVYRLDEAHFTIESVNRSSFQVHRVITILNADAAWRGQVAVHYDKLSKVQQFEAVVYDKDGREIHKLKNKDIIDQSNISGYSLYEDNRVKIADLRQKEYPYTIDVTYTVDYKFLYFVPDWSVIPGQNTSVEISRYLITTPEDLKPRYKSIRYDGEPEITESDGLLTYEWAFENYEAQEWEVFADRLPNNPNILVAPTKFQYEEYQGTMSTWDELAEWQLSLNEGRNDLSEDAKLEARLIAKEQATTRDKVQAIYEYMQNRTRYVSIQLGIGGWQPFPASSVHENGYGDCKALSFYTKSLLEAAGIAANYTLIYSGEDPPELYEDFPDRRFNHVILHVPNDGDTLWLECTSQNIPMGYIGESNSDRQALAITEAGGKIVRTPTYEFEDNHYVTSAEVLIDKQGNGNIVATVDFHGQATDHMGVRYYMHEDLETRKKWLEKFLDIPNYEVHDFNFESEKDQVPTVTLSLELAIRNVASVTGKRLFLQPNILNKKTFVPPSDERQTPIILRSAYLESDTIRYRLPEGAYVEKLPETIEVNSAFGDYRAEFQKTEDELIYVRTLRRKKGTWEAGSYEELVDFYKGIRRADRKKVIVSIST